MEKKNYFYAITAEFFFHRSRWGLSAMYCSNVLRLGYEYKMHKRIVNKRIQTRAVHLALWL